MRLFVWRLGSGRVVLGPVAGLCLLCLLLCRFAGLAAELTHRQPFAEKGGHAQQHGSGDFDCLQDEPVG